MWALYAHLNVQTVFDYPKAAIISTALDSCVQNSFNPPLVNIFVFAYRLYKKLINTESTRLFETSYDKGFAHTKFLADLRRGGAPKGDFLRICCVSL